MDILNCILKKGISKSADKHHWTLSMPNDYCAWFAMDLLCMMIDGDDFDRRNYLANKVAGKGMASHHLKANCKERGLPAPCFPDDRWSSNKARFIDVRAAHNDRLHAFVNIKGKDPEKLKNP